MSWNRVAVVGVGMIRFGELFELSAEAMAQRAYLNCLQSVDKGINPKEIQVGYLGTCIGTLYNNEVLGGSSVAGNLGLAGIPFTRVENGCATGSDAVRQAALAVASGLFDVALAVGVEKMKDKPSEEGMIGRAVQRHPILNRAETAVSQFAPQAVRHMHDYGTTREQMALVSVKNHKNGKFDPYAHFKFEVSVEQVLGSPMVCWPLSLLDCCPQTDGAAAALLVRADLAEKYTDKPVYIAGLGLGTDYQYAYEKESFTEFVATQRAAQQAYKMAGITPQDIDVAEVHDCFTITELLDMEDLGFCEKGQAGKLLERGETTLTGRIPINPSGGLLAKGHPLGASGIAQIAELYWHLRGEATGRQVAIRKGYALQHNVGGTGISNSVVTILTRNR